MKILLLNGWFGGTRILGTPPYIEYSLEMFWTLVINKHRLLHWTYLKPSSRLALPKASASRRLLAGQGSQVLCAVPEAGGETYRSSGCSTSPTWHEITLGNFTVMLILMVVIFILVWYYIDYIVTNSNHCSSFKDGSRYSTKHHFQIGWRWGLCSLFRYIMSHT